jgi:hypothetical protein
MNHFILDSDMKKSAEYHVDKHVLKMGIEATQMCSTALGLEFGVALGYSPVYVNHPLVKWTAFSYENWQWMVRYAQSMFDEYQYRWHREHASAVVLADLCNWVNQEVRVKKWKYGLTPFHLAVAQEQKGLEPVEAYRAYYIKYKARLFKWTARDIPYWIPKEML